MNTALWVDFIVLPKVRISFKERTFGLCLKCNTTNHKTLKSQLGHELESVHYRENSKKNKSMAVENKPEFSFFFFCVKLPYALCVMFAGLS